MNGLLMPTSPSVIPNCASLILRMCGMAGSKASGFWSGDHGVFACIQREGLRAKWVDLASPSIELHTKVNAAVGLSSTSICSKPDRIGLVTLYPFTQHKYYESAASGGPFASRQRRNGYLTQSSIILLRWHDARTVFDEHA
jgi:hypothetical protein